MVRLRWLSLCFGVSIAAACGGSSSETPWPQEPDSPALGPAGETKSPVVDEPDLADAGAARTRRAKSVEP